MLAFLGLVLCGAAYYFLDTQSDYGDVVKADSPLLEQGVLNEPITPIPLDLKLDSRKVLLGQRLFHDAQLSGDNRISCAQCHNLATGGADGLMHPVPASGIEGMINTLTVFNSGFNFRLFWDGRAATLEDQIDIKMQDSAAMGSKWTDVVAKLNGDNSYYREFSNSYKEGINPQTIMDALATYVRSLSTPNSRFDRYLRGDKHALDSFELAGYDLFKNLGCISCHQGRNVGGNMYGRLGLVGEYLKHRGEIKEVDFGRYNVTKNESDRYEFRVPSLRNVALTSPYLHDASASTLEVAVTIMGKYQLGVDLREEEVALIVKFLNALTGEYGGKPLSVSTQSKALR